MDIKLEEQPIVAQASGDKPEQFIEGIVNLNPDNDQVAPLEQSPVKVMLELTGSGSVIQRPGLDLVAVLDISTSMGNDGKLDKLKRAMGFIIKKLTPNDRLSIVTFDEYAEVLCGLRVMNDNFKVAIGSKVNDLAYRGNTNISDGLITGLNMLRTRRFTEDRVAGMMLMSDGEQNRGSDAAAITIDNVPVFTFSFGINQGAKVLRAIANNSRGGTFSDVQVLDDLNPAFAQILAGLVTVIVQDLQLNIESRNGTKIIDVSSGSYGKNPNTESIVTVLFGYLYDKEMRRVMVELLLPATTKIGDINVLEVTFSYRVGVTPFTSQRFLVYVERTRNPVQREKEEVIMEKKRLETTRLMKEAREMAENANLMEAKKKLNEAQQLLRGATNEDNPLVTTLKYELKTLLNSLRSLDTFKLKGLPFALSSETCHERQRYGARGDLDKVQSYRTPRMNEYLEQAKLFEKNPNISLPTADDDARQELQADPLGPIAGALNYHIQSAIQSLQSIANILNKSR